MGLGSMIGKRGGVERQPFGLSARALLSLAIALLGSPSAQAVTALKQVQISNGSQIDLLFDGKIQKGQIRTEFVNDIIQLSIQDVSVYPAKISSVNGGSLTKIFAYQYAPKLVRCRLTVKGKADAYKDKLEIKTSGRILTVSVAGGKAVPVETASEPDAEEKALLSRVLGGSAAGTAEKAGSKPTEKAAADSASEKPASDKPVAEKAAVTKASSERPAAADKDKERDSIATSASATAASTASTGDQPVRLTGSSTKLAGGKPLPSPLKAFAKLGIVLALFGLLAFALKRYAQKRAGGGATDALAKLGQPTTEGAGFFAKLGSLAKKGLGGQPKMIEVLSTHYLGPKKSIAVVRIAGRVMVLGVANESISLITQLEGDAAAEAIESGNLDLSDLAGSGKAPVAGSVAAGKALFADLLAAEQKRSGPAPSHPYAAAGPRMSPQAPGLGGLANPGPSFQATPVAPASPRDSVRSQIRNRLEGLKQL